MGYNLVRRRAIVGLMVVKLCKSRICSNLRHRAAVSMPPLAHPPQRLREQLSALEDRQEILMKMRSPMPIGVIQHRGRSFPLGATLRCGGANFSVFAKHSRAAQLLLFDCVDDPEPSRVIDLDPHTDRTYHYWHTFVPGVTAGQLYCYRVSGPFDPARGLRFDPNKVLLDPYGKCIARPVQRSREAAQKPGDNAAAALKSVVVDSDAYDWEGDAPLGRPFATTIIYEMHVGLYAASKLGRRAGQPWHLRRVDGKDTLFAGPGRQRGRAPSGLCVRRAGWPAGPRQLLGIPAPVVFFAP